MLATCCRSIKAPLTPIPARWHEHAKDSPLPDVTKAIVLAGVLIAFAVAFASRYSAVGGANGAFVINQWTGKVRHCDITSCLDLDR
jgi:hypothetical protein